jgi:hypothetical protein
MKTSIDYKYLRRASIVKEVMVRDLNSPYIFNILRGAKGKTPNEPYEENSAGNNTRR